MAPADASANQTWTVGASTERVAERLRPVLGDAAASEARELVAAVFGEPRFWPAMSAAQALAPDAVARLDAATERRVRGAPLAYAARTAAFRHLTLYVDERVLIPRPETEQLVEIVLASPKGRAGGVAADIGTGSGAIALALATEGTFRTVIATDISADALDVARHNAGSVSLPPGTAIELRAGDALTPLQDRAGSIDVLVSNPPYIAFAEAAELPAVVRDWEPPTALTCPDDGLAVTRAIVGGGGALLRRGGLLAMEVDVRRAQRVARMIAEQGGWREIVVLNDLTGRERFVLATWEGETGRSVRS